MELSDEYLANYFGLVGDDGKLIQETAKNKKGFDNYRYATQPYESQAQYERDKGACQQMQHNPIDTFLLVMAAKVERSDKVLQTLERMF